MSSEIDIFVSYARADESVVAPFVLDLRFHLQMYADRELRLWIDQDIAAGSNWPMALQHALSRARIMLAFVSPSYLNSDFAGREYKTSRLSGRPIVPVVLEEFHPNKDEVRELIGDQLWYSAPNLKKRDESYQSFINDLARSIVGILGDAAHTQTKAPPESSKRSASEMAATPAKGYVFLNYAEEDADFLAELRAFFGERGYAYWEFESSDRDYQKRIDLELEEVISRAVAIVSVLSEAWKASAWSLRELFFSQEIGKPVFLLKAKPLSATLAIAGFPYIDFTKNSQQAFSRLARELTRAGL